MIGSGMPLFFFEEGAQGLCILSWHCETADSQVLGRKIASRPKFPSMAIAGREGKGAGGWAGAKGLGWGDLPPIF